MPLLINGGPLDGGPFDFDTPPPGRITTDVPARSGGPGVAVYELDGRGAYRFAGWRDDEDDVGEGVTR